MTDLSQWGAAGAIIVVVTLFLKELKASRDSRDQERKAFTDTLLEFSKNMQKMVDNCIAHKQHGD